VSVTACFVAALVLFGLLCALLLLLLVLVLVPPRSSWVSIAAKLYRSAIKAPV
jgi:hypothetical protein